MKHQGRQPSQDRQRKSQDRQKESQDGQEELQEGRELGAAVGEESPGVQGASQRRRRWRGRRVLVTGGAGFIGSHLVEALVRAGAEVAVLDDLSTGTCGNLQAVLGRIRFFEGSILDRELLEPLVEEADVVFHLAAVVGVGLVLEQPVRTLDVNVEGTRNVLRAAASGGVGVLFASSSEVYGRAARPPFREEDELLFGATSEPRWSYAASKAIGEWEAFARAREEGLTATVVRLFNTVGPRQRGAYGMVLPRFVGAAVQGAPLGVYGDGHQTRSFCHVLDVVDALEQLGSRLALAARAGARVEPRVFNVGGDREVRIETLARLVRRMAGSRSSVHHMPYREAYGVHFEDLRRRRPDVTRLREALGWRPRRDLVQIVRELVEIARTGAPGPSPVDQRS